MFSSLTTCDNIRLNKMAGLAMHTEGQQSRGSIKIHFYSNIIMFNPVPAVEMLSKSMGKTSCVCKTLMPTNCHFCSFLY